MKVGFFYRMIMIYNNNLFIRFGEIPINEMSKNHLTGNYEIGVSVYECVFINNTCRLIFPNLTYSSCVSLSGLLDRPQYLVQGDIVGVGSDGEPLIKNVIIIMKINT